MLPVNCGSHSDYQNFVVNNLRKSLEKGLMNNSPLSIAGAGTPVVTSARERKHRVCDCSLKDIHN